MRFRLGVVVGFGAGYYLGAMAGRERYEQLNRYIRKAKRTEAYDVATDKARAVVDLGVERARDLVESKLGNGDSSSSSSSVDGGVADGNGMTGSGMAGSGEPAAANPYLRPSL